MAVVARRYDMLLVPPLQLAQTDSGNPRNVAAGVDSVGRSRRYRSRFFCFEHFTPLSFSGSPPLNCTRLAGTVKIYFIPRTQKRTDARPTARSNQWRSTNYGCGKRVCPFFGNPFLGA